MSSSQSRRPKPRARDAVSTGLDDAGLLHDNFTFKTDSAKPTQSSPKKTTASKRERSTSAAAAHNGKNPAPSATFVSVISLDAVVDGQEEDGDDDEYLFNRTKSRSGPSLLIDPVDLTALRSSSPDDATQRDGEAGDDSYDSDSIQSRRLNPWANRKKRHVRSDWTRTDSRTMIKKKSKDRASSSTPSSNDDDDEDEEDTTLTSPLRHDPDKAVRAEGTKRGKARSLSITPPPEVGQMKMKEVAQMIARVVDRGPTHGKDKDDENAVDAILNEDDEALMADLDPDLRRAMKGAGAGVLRKQLREKDERNRELAARAQRSMSRQTTSTSASYVSAKTIEISDSDSDDVAARATVAVPSISYVEATTSSTKKRRETRNSARARNSSSPILISVMTQKERTLSPMRKLPGAVQGRGLSRHSGDLGEDEESDGSQPTHSDSPACESRATQEQGEDGDRIRITMKGGPQGSLQIQVNVRQSTLMKTLLDHYMKVHCDHIPLDKTSKVRLRFDGDLLKDKDTVDSIGIEDEEQLDVVW